MEAGSTFRSEPTKPARSALQGGTRMVEVRVRDQSSPHDFRRSSIQFSAAQEYWLSTGKRYCPLGQYGQHAVRAEASTCDQKRRAPSRSCRSGNLRHSGITLKFSCQNTEAALRVLTRIGAPLKKVECPLWERLPERPRLSPRTTPCRTERPRATGTRSVTLTPALLGLLAHPLQLISAAHFSNGVLGLEYVPAKSEQ
jgi:hypothetical protein